MARKFSLLKGLGIVFLSVLVFFVAIFFYAYSTGGDIEVLTLFGSDGVGVLLIDGTINDSRQVLQNLKRFRQTKGVKAVVVRIDTPGGGVAPTLEIYE